MFPICFVQWTLSHVWVFATHRLQHTSLPCPSLSPRVCSNSCPLSLQCHPTFSSSVASFSSSSQSFPVSRSFPMSQLFTKYWSFSLSISPFNEYSGLISFRIGWLDLLTVQGTLKSLLQHTVLKHQLFGAQPSLQSKAKICTSLLEKP